jgi:hypothetical protein
LKYTVYILIVFIFCSCDLESEDKNIHSVYKPILIENSKLNECVFEDPKSNNLITLTRKIGTHILALDYGLGIHVIDVQNMSQPKKIGFYRIPACIDFEVKDQKVYANNYRDFIVVDFSNINSPTIVKRTQNEFSIEVKTPDGLEVFESLKKLPQETTIISYEKINQ